MLKLKTGSKKQVLMIYVILAAITLAVFWQVSQFDFVTLDDFDYVTKNGYVQSKISLNGILWAFSTEPIRFIGFWHPLTWLSLMLDYQVFGVNAGGYHMTNLVLHILSTLLLFWLFNRMTGNVWRSAFIAVLFAIHPLRAESVAWVSERKDVLSAFFWMLTLCFYVYYTEKPVIKRYLLVCLFFACGFMSKPTVVTLPVIMIILDYWPLKRFESQKGNIILWQLREKIILFIFSAVFSLITIYAHVGLSTSYWHFSIKSRVTNALIAFVVYLRKIFWPHDLAFCYPFFGNAPPWQTLGAALLIIAISAFVILKMKRFPYLFAGWLWYLISILPVIGIIPVGNNAMADRYIYLPSIGISIMLAWGLLPLMRSETMRKKILLPSAAVFLVILAILGWQQSLHWKNSIALFSNAVLINKNHYLSHVGMGIAFFKEGKEREAIDHYSQSIHIEPNYLPTYINRGIAYVKLGQYQKAMKDYNEVIRRNPGNSEAYNNRGVIYAMFGQYQRAIDDYNKAISLKPAYANAYYNRGVVYTKLGQYQRAMEDYNKAIHLKGDYSDAYYNRGIIHGQRGEYHLAIEDFNHVIRLKPDHVKAYNNRGFTYSQLGQYQQAINDYDKAISLKRDYTEAYMNRGVAYLQQGNKKLGCNDVQKACSLGNCATLESAKDIGICR